MTLHLHLITLTRRGKTKFATVKWYNLCLQITQSQTCYPLNKIYMPDFVGIGGISVSKTHLFSDRDFVQFTRDNVG